MAYKRIKDLIIGLLIVGLGNSCGKEVSAPPSKDEENPITSPTELVLSNDYVLNPKGGKVTATVRTKNGEPFTKLRIMKNGAEISEWGKAEGSTEYKFEYTLGTDEDLLGFAFIALGEDGKVQDSKLLHIERSRGLKPFNLSRISRVTGKSRPEETFPNPNNTDIRFDVGATDLGIVWQMGNGEYGFFFGDTEGKNFAPTPGGGGNGGNWRGNVLAFSNDTDLSDGLYFHDMLTNPDQPTVAKEVIHSDHITNGTGSFTTIPTSAIHANGAEYVHYMDIRQWGEPGKWATNFSELYTSIDNGRTWLQRKEVRFSSTSNFAQVAYAKKDGYVYMMGTPSGRFGAVHLARFLEADILKPANYEYLKNGVEWVKGNQVNATPIFSAPVGEISLAYNTHFKKWIVAYLNEDKAEIVMRYANQVSGPWSAEYTLVRGSDYPALYAPYIHPLSLNGDELYFLMTLWHPYNVFLMKAKLRIE